MTGEHTAAAIDYTRQELDLNDPQDRDLAAKYNMDSVVLDYLEMETDPSAKAEALAQHAAAVQDWATAPVYGEESASAEATQTSMAQEAAEAALPQVYSATSEEDQKTMFKDTESELHEAIEDYIDEILERHTQPLRDATEPEVESGGEIEYDLPDSVGEMFGTWDDQYDSSGSLEDTGEDIEIEGMDYDIPDAAGDIFDAWDQKYDSSGTDAIDDSVAAQPEYDIPDAAGDMFDNWDDGVGDTAETGEALDGSVSMDTDTGPKAATEGASTSEATA